MTISREPAVAGLFYPEDPIELAEMVDLFLADCSHPPLKPKALIVPHAGYIYSGSIAAVAYHTLLNMREKINKVVLLGPSHHVAFQGIAYSQAEQFMTPIGPVIQNHRGLEACIDIPPLIHNESAHRFEHSIEMQLPFLQRCLGEFELTALVVGDATVSQVSDILERLWGEEETIIIVSTLPSLPRGTAN